MRGEQEVEMADNPEEFWENPTIVFSILEKATTGDMNNDDYCTVLAYRGQELLRT